MARFVDRDMIMRYHFGLSAGHVYSHEYFALRRALLSNAQGETATNETPALPNTSSGLDISPPQPVTSSTTSSHATLITDQPSIMERSSRPSLEASTADNTVLEDFDTGSEANLDSDDMEGDSEDENLNLSDDDDAELLAEEMYNWN